MRVDAFDFDLPDALIADRPARPRDAARMLVVGDALLDRIVRDLPSLLAPGDVVVVNDTRVIPARLFVKRGEAKVELLLHKRVAPGLWLAFARPAKKLKPGDRLSLGEASLLVAEKQEAGEVVINFEATDAEVMALLSRHGHIPLPPYIKRADTPEDASDYQTLFARKDGAVAAPTAGLHFTPALRDAVAARGIPILTVTLHVGAGTFLPVKVDDTDDHPMHAEWGEVTAETADKVNMARAAGGRLLAIGTTCVRLLESAASIGGRLEPFTGETDIFITPGYAFRLVDRMLTNFHLPRSTLFMLVSAFAGLERMKAAYAHAIGERYRFYSYGDASLLERAS
ncbi:MAG: tRNA preQ1(34) S-adenosylmethionine ribosyltransferase-isomerase QueA [Alphaproteobacteria bacterium]|nr:tRNA preQ1(34) S-adenosylmethionine ribosyltransferase-isomerase QueA [Alphaproteobacteria bacterium]